MLPEWEYISIQCMKENPVKTNPSIFAPIVFMALTLILSACGVSAPSPAPTTTATATLMPTFTPTITLTPTKTPKPTATPNLTATQQYGDFIALVQQIYEAGQLSTRDGTYEKLDDFSDQLAMSYGYRWSPTGESPKNFIIRAEFDWEVANQKNYSGCGYVFRQTSEDHYYMIAMDALNGVVLFSTKLGLDQFGSPTTVHTAIRATKKEKLPDMGSNPYHAKVTLVLNESTVYMFVNDQFYSEHRLPQDKPVGPGMLSYLVLTGSATDYGTRCKIMNSEVWLVSP
jgi:hypothetical protein